MSDSIRNIYLSILQGTYKYELVEYRKDGAIYDAYLIGFGQKVYKTCRIILVSNESSCKNYIHIS